MDLEEVWEVVSWTCLAQQGQWCTLLSTVMNLLSPKIAENSLTSQMTTCLPRIILLNVVVRKTKYIIMNNKASVLYGSQLQ